MTTYISESIHEVYKTLFEALVLVVLVVYQQSQDIQRETKDQHKAESSDQ